MGPPSVPRGISPSRIELAGTPNAFGYTPSHAFYDGERHRRSNEVFADKDRLTLQFEARYMSQGERYGMVIGVRLFYIH